MFGKILVFLHLGLSLLFATWALVLFTNRMDWVVKVQEGKGSQPDGELVAEYKKLVSGGVRPADVRFRESRTNLVDEETRRPIERAWYGLQLEFLNSGAKDDNPARQIARDKDGKITLVVTNEQDKDGKKVKKYPPAGSDLLKMGPPQDKDGNPLNDRDGKPLVLRSLALYNKEYNTLLAQETAEMKRRNQFAEQDKAATNELKGDPKGLHARIRREALKQELMKDEYAEVRPLWLNTKVELLNLEALAGRLAQREKELIDMKSLGNKLGR